MWSVERQKRAAFGKKLKVENLLLFAANKWEEIKERCANDVRRENWWLDGNGGLRKFYAIFYVLNQSLMNITVASFTNAQRIDEKLIAKIKIHRIENLCQRAVFANKKHILYKVIIEFISRCLFCNLNSSRFEFWLMQLEKTRDRFDWDAVCFNGKCANSLQSAFDSIKFNQVLHWVFHVNLISIRIKLREVSSAI